MIRYEIARPGEEGKLLDFANYVFSNSSVPHDFRALLPKVYGEGKQFAEMHYVAHDENDNVKAMVAVLPQHVNICGQTLNVGSVGTVSVHPYARSLGYMKGIMHTMLEDSQAKGYDMLVLGGRRQRYNYFGFEMAGIGLSFNFTLDNLHHALDKIDLSGYTAELMTDNDSDDVSFIFDLYQKDLVNGVRPREQFLDCCKSWAGNLYLIKKNGQRIGALIESGANFARSDILAVDENEVPAIIKYKFVHLHPGIQSTSLVVCPYQKERISIFENIAESIHITTCQMINILHFKNVLSALFRLNERCRKLEDGHVIIRIEDETLCIDVKDGVSTVSESTETPEIILSKMQAQRLFFLPSRIYLEAPEQFKNWLPLPWCLPKADHF